MTTAMSVLDVPFNPLLLLDDASLTHDEKKEAAMIAPLQVRQDDDKPVLERQQQPYPENAQKSVMTLQVKDMTRYREERMQQTKEKVPVVTLRRKTTFFGLLLVICQLAYVDVHNLLPLGIILYAVGIGLVLELLENPDEAVLMMIPWEEERQRLEEAEEQVRIRHHRQQEQFRQKELVYVQEMANFEFHVLQGKPKVRVIAREDENGQIIYYTS
jgi:hypothetical protein